MATIVENVKALLDTAAAAGGCWYGANTQQPAAFPYIVFQRVVSSANVDLSGRADMQNTRFQVDIYSLNVSEIVALGNAVDLAFENWSTPNVPLSSQDFYEDDVRCYRTSKDFSVWSTN